ncbi:MAG: Thymidylate kinase [Candidatus Amesbacteria bacterium GW2011_GWA2_42_12]|uniref:Thymidylate kinase n=1 Tax=Candidatus Amesbacteria bacterium GW2011_GWA2_42_12 TaxID=1618356 RepID=A0A0G1B650_9BACT|nr:MAG: Thymidylate kinase [Candidatus Amesbacteria bacterium GW2011_GWA2_42_12]
MLKKPEYIAFEGIVGCGKTTQSQILAEKLGAVWTKEPGGDEISDAIRKVVQGTVYAEEMDPVCEQYLYAASRAQILRKVIKPVLDKRGIVVADRSVFTSMTYQGFGRNLGIERVLKINKEAVGDVWPDLVIWLDTDLDTALARTRDASGDKFESMDKSFFEKVREGYVEVTKRFPKLVKKVDGNGSIEVVEKRIWKVVQQSSA